MFNYAVYVNASTEFNKGTGSCNNTQMKKTPDKLTTM